MSTGAKADASAQLRKTRHNPIAVVCPLHQRVYLTKSATSCSVKGEQRDLAHAQSTRPCFAAGASDAMPEPAGFPSHVPYYFPDSQRIFGTTSCSTRPLRLHAPCTVALLCTAPIATAQASMKWPNTPCWTALHAPTCTLHYASKFAPMYANLPAQRLRAFSWPQRSRPARIWQFGAFVHACFARRRRQAPGNNATHC
jgi:hypothetical protein